MANVGRVDSAIRGQNDPHRRTIAERAEAQHGVVARGQLIAMGFGRNVIDRMVAGAYLQPLHRGVYAVGHRKVSRHGWVMACVIACGLDALASHLAGAFCWTLLRGPGTHIDVTVPGRRGGGTHPGIRLHRPRNLHPDDRAIVDGIPCTSVARVLLDLADSRPHVLRRAFEEAERQRVLELRQVHALLERARGHRGVKPLAALLEAVTDPPPLTRSEVEESFRDFLREEGIRQPDAMNVLIEEFEVDAVWFAEGVIVEIDHLRDARSSRCVRA